MDVSIVSSFFVQTQESIRAAVSQLPFSEAVLLVASRHPVVLSKVFSMMLVDVVLKGYSTYLLRSFPEIYYFYDLRLDHVTCKLNYIQDVAGLVRCLARTETVVSSDAITLLAESLTVESLLAELNEGLEPAFQKALARVTPCMLTSVNNAVRDLVLRFLAFNSVRRVPHCSDPSGAHAWHWPSLLSVEACSSECRERLERARLDLLPSAV